MVANQRNQSNETAWFERLERIRTSVQHRLGSDPNACMANVTLDDLIDLVRALAERVAVLEAGR